ncbi:MAG: hypothetical protein GXO26_01210 [Crenarchaeota archaeon]|nr:hypothetical protein [Thermoproteota archaeon]
MKVRILTPRELVPYFASRVISSPFKIFMHILTKPFLTILLEKPPSYIREISEITLDNEKYIINDYAIEKLHEAGYLNLYYINRLHAKIIMFSDAVILCTANMSFRSLRNYELCVLLEDIDNKLEKELYRKFIRHVESYRDNAIEEIKRREKLGMTRESRREKN